MVLVTSWPQRELSRPERDLWMHDLAQMRFEDAKAAVMSCRRTYDWLPTARQFAEAYGAAANASREQLPPVWELDDNGNAKPGESRALGEATRETPPDATRRHMEQIRRQLSSATGPLARSLRDEFSPEVGA